MILKSESLELGLEHWDWEKCYFNSQIWWKTSGPIVVLVHSCGCNKSTFSNLEKSETYCSQFQRLRNTRLSHQQILCLTRASFFKMGVYVWDCTWQSKSF